MRRACDIAPGTQALAGLLAAAMGRPIRVSREGEASLRGAAVRTLQSAGMLAPGSVLEEPVSTSIEPHPARSEALAEAAERQSRMYEALLG